LEKVKDIDATDRAARGTGVEVTNFLVNSPDGEKGGSLVKSGDREKYLERLIEINHNSPRIKL